MSLSTSTNARKYSCLNQDCLHTAEDLILEDETQAIECGKCGSMQVEVLSELYQQEKKEMAWA